MVGDSRVGRAQGPTACLDSPHEARGARLGRPGAQIAALEAELGLRASLKEGPERKGQAWTTEVDTECRAPTQRAYQLDLPCPIPTTSLYRTRGGSP
jgi:hypothetical protein